VVLILLSFLLLMTAVCVLFYRKWFWYCYHSSHWGEQCIYGMITISEPLPVKENTHSCLQ
jgi:hypothetical protein